MVTRLANALRRRISLLIGRAVIRAVKADGGRVLLTLDMLNDETSGAVELAEPWGFTSIPLEGAEAVTLAVMGERGNKVAISLGDRRHRPKDGVPGESILFDDQGQRIAVRRDGIEITAPLGLRIKTPSMTVNGKAVSTVDHLVEVGSGSSSGRWPLVTGVGKDV